MDSRNMASDNELSLYSRERNGTPSIYLVPAVTESWLDSIFPI